MGQPQWVLLVTIRDKPIQSVNSRVGERYISINMYKHLLLNLPNPSQIFNLISYLWPDCYPKRILVQENVLQWQCTHPIRDQRDANCN